MINVKLKSMMYLNFINFYLILILIVFLFLVKFFFCSHPPGQQHALRQKEKGAWKGNSRTRENVRALCLPRAGPFFRDVTATRQGGGGRGGGDRLQHRRRGGLPWGDSPAGRGSTLHESGERSGELAGRFAADVSVRLRGAARSRDRISPRRKLARGGRDEVPRPDRGGDRRSEGRERPGRRRELFPRKRSTVEGWKRRRHEKFPEEPQRHAEGRRHAADRRHKRRQLLRHKELGDVGERDLRADVQRPVSATGEK